MCLRTIKKKRSRIPFAVWVWALLCLFDKSAFAQETPSLNVKRWSVDQTFKTDLCDRQQQLNNGEITLDEALKGLQISAALTQYETPTERHYFSLREDAFGVPRIRRYDPGLYVVVLDEVAERAGFTWRNSFATVSPINPDSDPSDVGKSWTDMLTWEMDVYDISIDYWLKAVSRMKLGVYFTAPFLDSSMILVETPWNNPDSTAASSSSSNVMAAQVVQNVSIWAFFQPFTSGLWLVCVLGLVVTGLLYWFIEHLENDLEIVGASELLQRASSTLLGSENDNHRGNESASLDSTDQQQALLEHTPCDSMYFAAITFTQHFEFRPKSNTARLLSFSWAFWAVIVGSAYTANLASFLVTQRQIKYSGYSIEQVMDTKDPKPVCVHAATLPDQYLSRAYPNATNIVRKYQEPDIFDALKERECTVAALPLNMWQIYERNSFHNKDCMLKFMGNVIKYNPGSFVTSADTTDKCSSLLGFVLDYFFLEMRSDGTLTRIWEEHLDRVGNQQCGTNIGSSSTNTNQENPDSAGTGDVASATAPPLASENDEQIVRLTISDMGGIFLLHAIMSVLALAMALTGFYARKRHLKRLADEGESQNDLHLETKWSTAGTGMNEFGDTAHSRESDNGCSFSSERDILSEKRDGSELCLGDCSVTTTRIEETIDCISVQEEDTSQDENNDRVVPMQRRDVLLRNASRRRTLARSATARLQMPPPEEEDEILDRRSGFRSAHSVRFRNERRASVFNAF